MQSLCLPHGMFKTKKESKRAENERKIQLTAVPPGRFAGAPYHDDAPRDFGPQIAYACWRWFQVTFRYPVPDKAVRERKVGPYLSSTLLDFKLRFSHLFISQCSHRVFHVVHSEVPHAKRLLLRWIVEIFKEIPRYAMVKNYSYVYPAATNSL